MCRRGEPQTKFESGLGTGKGIHNILVKIANYITMTLTIQLPSKTLCMKTLKPQTSHECLLPEETEPCSVRCLPLMPNTSGCGEETAGTCKKKMLY